MDEQWGYVEKQITSSWLFYAYDRIRRDSLWRTSSVNALWPPLERLLEPAVSAFGVLVVWIIDGWLAAV